MVEEMVLVKVVVVVVVVLVCGAIVEVSMSLEHGHFSDWRQRVRRIWMEFNVGILE
jgi:hypothetical protein